MTEHNPSSFALAAEAELLLYELFEAHDGGAFATACDGYTRRKLAWKLEELGLARWCGTNWGSSFFAITAAGKAHIDTEVKALRARLDAQALEAQQEGKAP